MDLTPASWRTTDLSIQAIVESSPGLAAGIHWQKQLDTCDTQSAYHQYHSTETAVMKLCNDMLLAADSGQLTALCLHDLTAAFDTVDHDLLLLCLERQFGLQGVMFQLFCSYLASRSFRVLYCN